MPSKTTKTTKPSEPKKTATKTATSKAAMAKATAAKPATTKAAEAKKAPVRAAKPTPTTKAGATGIGDTVRAVVDAAAAIVGAAVAVHGTVTGGKKAGKTSKKIGRALEIAGGVTAAAAALVNLNRAEPDTLASLKHIGPKRAQKIVEARPFQAVDELAARKLLPKKVVDELRERLSV